MSLSKGSELILSEETSSKTKKYVGFLQGQCDLQEQKDVYSSLATS